MKTGVHPEDLLCRIADVVTSPLSTLAEEFSSLLEPVIPHTALVLFTASPSGGWTTGVGDREFLEGIKGLELDQLRRDAPEAQTVRRIPLRIGAREYPTLQAVSRNGALLVLAGPGPADSDTDVLDIWNVVAVQVQSPADNASAGYLHDARVSAGERLDALTELADEYSTTLESILSALRSPGLGDSAARQLATASAAQGLVQLRTAGDRVRTLTEEPVTTAFARLQHDLRPVTQHRDVRVQFIEPPVDGRPLPGEVARGARAVVRGAILTIADLPEVTRVRVEWGCDGKNLLINIRDDGPGRREDAAALQQSVSQRVRALSARLSVQHTAGWGTEMSIVVPLDPPRPTVAFAVTAGLRPREVQVLDQLVAGRRNREIAAALGISENTVKFHISRILRALGVGSRSEAISLLLAQRHEARVLAEA